MASALLLDLSRFDLSQTAYTRAQIYARLPQRHEFMQLDRVIHLDGQRGEAIALRHVCPDEWWCKAHLPGNPLLPGVLMIEAAAQLAALMDFYSREGCEGFVGFGGVDNTKFRRTVIPPSDLWLLCRRVELRTRRLISEVQGVVDGELVFETRVTGMLVPLTNTRSAR